MKEKEKVARPGRLELPTLCLEVKSRYAISLLFLGSAYFLHHDFVWYSGCSGPKLDPPKNSYRTPIVRPFSMGTVAVLSFEKTFSSPSENAHIRPPTAMVQERFQSPECRNVAPCNRREDV